MVNAGAHPEVAASSIAIRVKCNLPGVKALVIWSVAAQNVTLERPRMSVQRILLVEDDEDVGELFAYVLREEGYDVDVAGTVAAAWAHLDAHSYALVIADWRLPDGDGTGIADGAAELGAKTFLMSGYLPLMPGGRAEGHETIMKTDHANRPGPSGPPGNRRAER